MTLPDRVLQIRDRLLVKFPLPYSDPPSAGKEEAFRIWCIRFGGQLAYSEPGDGWGVKSASPDRPISKDTVAQQQGGRLICWDLFMGVGTDSTGVVVAPQSEDVTGQTFHPVTPLDVLNGAFPPDDGGEPPQPPVTLQSLSAQIATLDHLVRYDHGGALAAIMDKLGIPH